MAEQNKRFAYQANMFIDNDNDRQNLYAAIDTFHRTQDMAELANTLKTLLNKSERLRMYDAARALIPIQRQMDYNLMTPYVNHRSRTVKMARQKGFSYGFAIRGGKEHGTGIFISEVVAGSEAQTQGLKVGDQILRVNGFSIDEAIHEEVISLLKSRNSLNLKVKSVGMIPVKNEDDDIDVEEDDVFEVDASNQTALSDTHEPASSATIHTNDTETRGADVVSWRTVDQNDQSAVTHRRKTSSSASVHSGEYLEFRVTLNVGSARKSFGCNICKGPTDLPGIFIQSIKEGGLASDAGLRPGDQLLEANGLKLNNIQFHEAVDFLKSFDQVELLVRKGVAAYLFPGESSGYNSSNSSVNEDGGSTEEYHSPLAAVKEENSSSMSAMAEEIKPASKKPNDHQDGDGGGSELKAIGHLDDVIAAGVEPTWSEKTHLETFKREEEESRQVQERLEERMRTIEYASRLEAQQVNEVIVENASELMKRRRTLSSTSNVDELPVTNTSKNDLQNMEEMLRNVERLETGGTTSDANGNVAASASDESTNRRQSSDRWQKTILAEVHNTPTPCKLNGSPTRSQSDEHVIETLKSTTNKQEDNLQCIAKAGASRNSNENQQQRNQHDQLIEEFKKVHKKMIASQEVEEETPQKETPMKIVNKAAEIKPVSILKKPAPENKFTEEARERPILTKTQVSASTTPVHVSPVVERKELEKALKNLKRTTLVQQDLPKENNLDQPRNETSTKRTLTTPPSVLVTFKPTKSTSTLDTKWIKNVSNGSPPRAPLQTENGIISKSENTSDEKMAQQAEVVAIKNGKTKAITDSSLRIPKPPNYFFPKSKTAVQVIVQSYQSGATTQAPKVTPQRFEFLKSHPSIEIEMTANDGPAKTNGETRPIMMNGSVKAAAPQPPAASVSGVTKVIVNKTPANSNVRQAIEKFKAVNGDPQPITTKSSVANGRVVQSDASSNIKAKPLAPLAPVEHADANSERMTKRQRTPTIGDHKVSIKVVQEPIVIISSQN